MAVEAADQCTPAGMEATDLSHPPCRARVGRITRVPSIAAGASRLKIRTDRRTMRPALPTKGLTGGRVDRVAGAGLGRRRPGARRPARAGRKARLRDLPLPAGERFVVLIADLQDDDAEKSHTRHVVVALAPYRGLDVQRIGPRPEWDVGSRDEFEARGRALLEQRRGDVLITRDVAAAGKGVRLRLLPSACGRRRMRFAPSFRSRPATASRSNWAMSQSNLGSEQPRSRALHSRRARGRHRKPGAGDCRLSRRS
jgi:hypothetical protein